jgi:tRNA (adenine57-N1/adenine58-N1)-methyltransferase
VNKRGPFVAGDQVQLTDPKGRMHQIVLREGGEFHTHRGALKHDELIGAPEGSVVIAAGGTAYVALRPLLADFTLAMKRGAALIYPKDAAQILAYADIFPGARVLEAGAGSGALSCWLLRAIGPSGQLISFERRADFAQIAAANVEKYFGESPAPWRLRVGDFSVPGSPEFSRTARADSPMIPAPVAEDDKPGTYDRVILDMLAPWECIADAATALVPGGLICVYVATTTQLSRVTEELRAHGSFFEPAAWETLMRGWHLDGLAVRPEHRMIGHTAFLVTARRLADGVTAPARRRRPSKGAHPADSAPDGRCARGGVEPAPGTDSTGRSAEDFAI